ncbi:MAG: penicillin-binding protein 1A [Cellvibrionaceae bacterium]|jgi:penicillin-binding protein 1A
MQVARNFFLSREQTFSRKFNEIFLAIKIEQYLSKQEILELYLNKIYLGNRAYGVRAAAKVYYGKELNQLSAAQIAMIAGLPKAPSTYNPIANPSRALARRNYVLRRMNSLDKLTEEDFKLALAAPVTARYYGQNLELNAPYVAEAAREKAIALFGENAYINGYKVFTTVDSRLQDSAQKAVVQGLLNYDLRHGYRGPEQELDPSALEPLSEINNNESAQSIVRTNQNRRDPNSIVEELGSVNLTPWLETVKKMPSYGLLEPGIVMRIGKDYISVLNSMGQTIDIEWENGLKGSRLYVNENFASSAPTSPAKLVKLGDVIRMYRKQDAEQKDEWHFSQVPSIESALVSISPDDGAIRSIVGGFDFNKSSFNRAIQAKRQPGSNFKPFVYTAALESGVTPGSIINDAPIVVEDTRLEDAWRPENSSGEFYGPTRVRKALYLSRNLVSIRLLRSIGIDTAIASMARFGIDTSKISRNLSMALGSHVMTPLEVATGYSVFANGGYKIEPYLIHHIRDRHDEILFKEEPKVAPSKKALVFTTTKVIVAPNPPELTSPTIDPDATTERSETNSPQITPTTASAEEAETEGLTIELSQQAATKIVDERIVYLMNSMLRDVIKRGTGRLAQSLGRNDLAGKTGTTNGPIDAWFSGYNSHVVTTSWVGFDNNQKLGGGEYGGIAALPIWIDYMETALKDVPPSFMPQPNGIVTVSIDAETGARARPSNPNSIEEIFLEENAPPTIDPTQVVNGGSNSPAPEELF